MLRFAILAGSICLAIPHRVTAQSINVDFGGGASTPAATYGAAGNAGTWNSIGVQNGFTNRSANASCVHHMIQTLAHMSPWPNPAVENERTSGQVSTTNPSRYRAIGTSANRRNASRQRRAGPTKAA